MPDATDAAAWDDIDPKWRPSAYQRRLWGSWVKPEFGCDLEGYILGSCPLHDKRKTEDSAVFNFAKGVMKCQGYPCCHEDRGAMSLSRVVEELVTR